MSKKIIHGTGCINNKKGRNRQLWRNVSLWHTITSNPPLTLRQNIEWILFPWRGQFSLITCRNLDTKLCVTGCSVLDPSWAAETVTCWVRPPWAPCIRLRSKSISLSWVLYEFCKHYSKERRNILNKTESLLIRMRPMLLKFLFSCRRVRIGLIWRSFRQDPNQHRT